MRLVISSRRGPFTHDPNLPVKEGILDEFVLVLLGTTVIVESESLNHEVTLGLSEELGSVGVIMKHPE